MSKNGPSVRMLFVGKTVVTNFASCRLTEWFLQTFDHSLGTIVGELISRWNRLVFRRSTSKQPYIHIAPFARCATIAGPMASNQDDANQESTRLEVKRIAQGSHCSLGL